GGGGGVPPMEFASLGHIDADGGDESEIRRLLKRCVPTPLACFNEPLELRRPAALPPATYVQCTDKPADAPFLGMVARLRASGWDVRTVPAGHFSLLTLPGATARLLAEIAAI